MTARTNPIDISPEAARRQAVDAFIRQAMVGIGQSLLQHADLAAQPR
jgi:hypothetical protein